MLPITSRKVLGQGLLVAIFYLNRIDPICASESDPELHSGSNVKNQLVYHEDKTYLRTNVAVVNNSFSEQRRHLSFWGGLLNHLVCPTHPHDCHPHLPHPHHKKSGGGKNNSDGSASGSSSGSGSGSSSGSGGDEGCGGSACGDQNSDANDTNDNTNGNGDDDGSNSDSSGTDDNGSAYDQQNDDGQNDDVYSTSSNSTSTAADAVSNDDSDWYKGNSKIMGDMMYGAIGIGGIAVFASFISRNGRRNANMNDHLLSGAVGKRKNRFSGLFSKKPSDSVNVETPGSTPYTNV